MMRACRRGSAPKVFRCGSSEASKRSGPVHAARITLQATRRRGDSVSGYGVVLVRLIVSHSKMGIAQQSDLSGPLRLSTAFRFPLQSRIARAEVAIGALWLLVPVVGWILDMGHRIAMTLGCARLSLIW